MSEQGGVKTDTTSKAEEAKKLLDEVGRLHMQAEHKSGPEPKNLSPEEHTRRLAELIMRLEAEQKIAREQINHLHHAKAEFDLSRLRKREPESGAHQASNEQLGQQLSDLIKQKEAEYLELVREVEAVRLQAERETSLLETQRDAARAMIAQQRGQHPPPPRRRIPMAAVQTGIFILGLGLGLVGVYVKFVVMDGRPFPGFGPEVGQTTALQPVAEPVVTEKIPLPKALGEFRDELSSSSGQGPLMVRLPGGAYRVGSPPHRPYPEEQPQHQVMLRSFSIAKHETSFAEYTRFAEATGRRLPDDAGFGQGRQPVINVSWEDAAAYAQWLTSETGQQYRLPSEREWEYAASAGSGGDILYWWGNDPGGGHAVCAECGSRWDSKQPAPVGSLPPNALGLHEMLGNVMEWTVECRHLDYTGAPAQAQVWEGGGDCTRYMVRGGSYRTSARDLRTTRRAAYPPKAYSDELGFRVVRVD